MSYSTLHVSKEKCKRTGRAICLLICLAVVLSDVDTILTLQYPSDYHQGINRSASFQGCVDCVKTILVPRKWTNAVEGHHGKTHSSLDLRLA
jgi:hypothetical protein